MDINNTLITQTIPRNLQDDRQSRADTAQRAEVRPRAASTVAPEIDSDELQRRGEQAQAERVQRINSLESAPLQTRQALELYQQSSSDLNDPSQGELVGVDLFV